MHAVNRISHCPHAASVPARAVELLVHAHVWHAHEELVRVVRRRLRGRLLRELRSCAAPPYATSTPTLWCCAWACARWRLRAGCCCGRGRRARGPPTPPPTSAPVRERQRSPSSPRPRPPALRLCDARAECDSLGAGRRVRACAWRYSTRAEPGAGKGRAASSAPRGRSTSASEGDRRPRRPRHLYGGRDRGVGACPGFAPDVSLTMVRVFDSRQESTTRVPRRLQPHLRRARDFDLISLSVGGPDHRDVPFAPRPPPPRRRA